MNRTAEGGIGSTALCRVEVSCEVVQTVGERSDGRLKVFCCYMHVTTGVAHTDMHIQVGVHAYTSVLIVTFIFLYYPCIVLSFYCNLHLSYVY